MVVRLRLKLGEELSEESPLLVLQVKGRMVPLTGAIISRMDMKWAHTLGLYKETIHSRRRGFATAAVRCGVHMASITIAMRHSQGVTMQYVALSMVEKASIFTRLAIVAYEDKTHADGIIGINKVYENLV